MRLMEQRTCSLVHVAGLINIVAVLLIRFLIFILKYFYIFINNSFIKFPSSHGRSFTMIQHPAQVPNNGSLSLLGLETLTL